MGYGEQARLSEQHRAAQTRLMAIVAADTARVFPLLDISNVDRTFGSFVDGMEQTVNARRTISSSLSSTYYNAIRGDVNVRGDFSPRLFGQVGKDQLFTSLLVAGPVSIKKNLAAGVSAETARQAALTNTIKTTQRHVVNGGRATILDSVRRDPSALGWSRLTDGQPCAFCALLASRGPAYKSEGTSKFRAHDGCGCTAVPVFDVNAPWPGRAEEFRELYDQNVQGRFLGGDGNNEAVRAFRKVYDRGVTTTTASAASAAAPAAAPAATGFLARWQAAKARIADPTQIGRLPGTQLSNVQLAELTAATARIEFLQDWANRFNRAGANKDQLREEFNRVTGASVSSNIGLQVRYPSLLEDARRTKRSLENRRAGEYDRVNGLPGAKLNEELDSVLDAGAALGTELDRRIALRVANATTDEAQLAKAVAAREAIEKQIEDARSKAERLRDEARGEATRRVDSGATIWRVTPENRSGLIDREVSMILRKNRSYSIAVNKTKRLQTDRNAAVRLEEQLRNGSVQPGTSAYATILREETLKLLDEVNPTGGVRLAYKTDAGKAVSNKELSAAMEFAEDSYPAAWMERLRARFPEINLGTSKRGYNSGGSKIRLSRHSIRQIDGDQGYHAVAVHELGHSMEEVIPGLKELQWAYHARRGSVPGPDGTPILPRPTWMGSGYRRDEVSIPDQWREPYTGKVYGGNPDSNGEVFTTGIEALLSGSRYFNARGDLGVDTEFRDWMLGVLSVLR